MSRFPSRSVLVMTLVAVVGVGLLMADGGANHQVSTTSFGSSGGNALDRSNAFCCSGTLGALVTKGGTNYVLSNNHVLGRSGVGAVGEDITQPGAIDVGCNLNNTRVVADLSETAPLGGANGVDAAIAQLRSGQMDANGSIVDLGQPSQTIAAPAVGAAVVKSGRTTGCTAANIQSINTSVSVQYQQGCGKGKKFTVSYTNQIVIGSSSFSAGGDSGSLIMTSANAQPVGLLFAGSSTTTIANRASEVASRLGVTFVGGGNHSASCPSGGGGGGGGPKPRGGPNASEIDRATAAKELHVRRLMANPAIMAVGVGANPDNEDEAVINIYVEQGRAYGRIPEFLNGVRTNVIATDKIRAFGWNEKQPGSCSAK